MADFTVAIDDEVLEVLKTIAEHRNLKVEDILREMVMEDIEGIKRRRRSPITGMLSKYGDVEEDVASRADDIIHNEWQPD